MESSCSSAFPRLQIWSHYFILTVTVSILLAHSFTLLSLGITSLWGQNLEVVFLRHGCPGYWTLIRGVKQ